MEILVQNLSKKFRQEFVIRQFNYTFQSRNSYAITGPNGSGKSTLLQLLAQFTLPNTGTVEMSGVDPDLVYSQITYAAPYVELIEEYTLAEHLEILSKNNYLPSSITLETLERFIDLQPGRYKLIKNYSSGMRQKIKLGFALLSERPVLLLDEPTTNFDEQAKNWFFERLEQQRNKLIIIASNESREINFCQEKISIQEFK
ncbi:ABC transporter ATP-binding protein [Aquirufa antheringensis]|jgi:ABC-type multidrug transport system ATPase subunit|uniref:ATP-binding cassette domain-containing protein n=1 Tax=Aquirufa antheringensis TaxID=2516559 RepID=A0A4Q9BDD8_9BACT|nr:ATP-binding cassette domain-containing protein [Aquirufa antheringensis]MCZ2486106.1 ATP-binding cassette domain-containing protein [Aquirufa antheringensis]MCZ2486203.1 ATP-binding cassette domain-containing protein [Aquirufa antheringensis]TBH73118.1 ATP-binding cassette domain-containing protein [Aquirufa antheringensis]